MSEQGTGQTAVSGGGPDTTASSRTPPAQAEPGGNVAEGGEPRPGDAGLEPGGGLTRKQFLVGAAGTGALVAGGSWFSHASALAAPRRGRPGTLNAAQTTTLVAWCDLLVPGAAANGVGRFVNDQLALPHEVAKLMLRYLNWDPPYVGFYAGGLAALDAASRQLFGRPFVKLTIAEQGDVRDQALADAVPWQGPPPAGLFYFATRGDAVDVMYGTVQGFERIDFPYQSLIEPRKAW